jgi:hypothetical protein
MIASITARAIHLIDIENMAGTSHVTEEVVRTIKANYIRVVGLGATDHVVIAASHHNALAAGYGWPKARLLCRSGPDGADTELQDVMNHENAHQRFERCYLSTGDGGFAEAVAALSGRGLRVEVIAPAGGLSAKLTLAATASCECDLTHPADTRKSA